jgi:hypothetical protein
VTIGDLVVENTSLKAKNADLELRAAIALDAVGLLVSALSSVEAKAERAGVDVFALGSESFDDKALEVRRLVPEGKITIGRIVVFDEKDRPLVTLTR